MNDPPTYHTEARPVSSGSSPAWLLPVYGVGLLLALVGTYWDDAWHTDKGRDTFFIAPHVLLYAGITLVGGAVSLWALLAVRRSGWPELWRQPPLKLAAAGVAVTLGAAPIDNAWHLAWGRDAVLWSPPHMLGVAGTLAIAAAVLLDLSREPRRSGWVTAIAGAAVLGAAMIPVLEYDTDVPQFDAAFFLPVLAIGGALAFALIARVSGDPWAVSRAAALYTGLRGALAVLLAVEDYSGALLPALLVPAVAFDVCRARHKPLAVTAAAVTGATFLAYVPYLNLALDGVQLDLTDVVIGLPLAFAGVWLALTALEPRRARSKPARPRGLGIATSVLGLLLVLILAPVAGAHDPGQGDELTTAQVVGSVDESAARLVVRTPSHCADLLPRRVVARRAGDTVAGRLQRTGACGFAGQVRLPDRGRWFVYAELEHRGRTAETWLPLLAPGPDRQTDAHRSVYLPPERTNSALKTVGGGLLYLVVIAVLIVIARLYRNDARTRANLRAA